MSVSIECVVSEPARLGEGAVWDAADAALWWVDIKAGLIHRFDPVSGTNARYDFGEPVGCLSRREQGGLIVAAQSGLWFYEPASGKRQALTDPESDLPGNRFNDGTTDYQGRFWAGTMKDDGGEPEPRGQFYRYDPDGTLTPFFEKLYTTNGTAFSPDGRTMYFADTNASVRTIWACDYDTDTGTPSNRRVFFDSREVAGRPDGGTVDTDGCYWMAGVGGWQVVRITPAGKVDRIIELPVEKPTKPMFGGTNLDTLYVTSIGIEGDDRQPLAGCLFAIGGLGVGGIPQPRFGG